MDYEDIRKDLDGLREDVADMARSLHRVIELLEGQAAHDADSTGRAGSDLEPLAMD